MTQAPVRSSTSSHPYAVKSIDQLPPGLINLIKKQFLTDQSIEGIFVIPDQPVFPGWRGNAVPLQALIFARDGVLRVTEPSSFRRGDNVQWVPAEGIVLSELRYSAWGETRNPNGTAPTQRRYTGQLEAEAGLYFYNARWYDPSLGRFAQADAILTDLTNPDAFDRYAYSRNNPVNYIDPSGHFPWPIFLILAIAGVGIYEAIDIASVSPITERSAPAPTSNDMTGWLTDRINENANSPVMKALNENITSGDLVKEDGGTKAWVALVRGGATWDYKTDIIKAGVKDNDGNIILGGEKLNFQAIANIHYGAMGRAAGFSQFELEAGAGIFQIHDNWGKKGIGSIDTYFDDPYDNWMVKFGCWLYDNYHDQFGKLTPEQLEDAFKTYEKDHGSPGNPIG